MKVKMTIAAVCLFLISASTAYASVGEGVSPAGKLTSMIITVTYPNTRVILIMGQQYEITWTDNITENVKITLMKSGLKARAISSSTDSDGSFMWTIPVNLTPGNDYKVRISGVTTRGVQDQSDQKFGLSLTKQQTALGNFPNPFNPSTIIKYSIPYKAEVKLQVFNVLGQVVAELVNQEQDAGIYEAEFDGSKLSSGIYFYQLTAQDKEGNESSITEIKKMMLLK